MIFNPEPSQRDAMRGDCETHVGMQERISLSKWTPAAAALLGGAGLHKVISPQTHDATHRQRAAWNVASRSFAIV